MDDTWVAILTVGVIVASVAIGIGLSIIIAYAYNRYFKKPDNLRVVEIVSGSKIIRRVVVYGPDDVADDKPLDIEVKCKRCKGIIRYDLSLEEAVGETFLRPCPTCGKKNTFSVPPEYSQVANEALKTPRKPDILREPIIFKRFEEPDYGKPGNIVAGKPGYIKLENGEGLSVSYFRIDTTGDGYWDGWAVLEWECAITKNRDGIQKMRGRKAEISIWVSYPEPRYDRLNGEILIGELLVEDTLKPRLEFTGSGKLDRKR